MESQYGSSDKNTTESNGGRSIQTCKEKPMSEIKSISMNSHKNKSICTEEVKNASSDIKNKTVSSSETTINKEDSESANNQANNVSAAQSNKDESSKSQAYSDESCSKNLSKNTFKAVEIKLEKSHLSNVYGFDPESRLEDDDESEIYKIEMPSKEDII